MSGKRRIGEKRYRVTVVLCTNYERHINAVDETEARHKLELDLDRFPLAPRWKRTAIRNRPYLADLRELR